MTEKHTPGPWSKPVPYGATRFEIQSTGVDAKRLAVADTLADARLISVAPDLLGALEAIVAWDNLEPPYSIVRSQDIFSRARAAIAKATSAGQGEKKS